MTFHSLYYQDYFKTRVDINAAWIVGMKKKKRLQNRRHLFHIIFKVFNHRIYIYILFTCNSLTVLL